MGTNFGNLGSLGDFFKQTGTEQPCRVRGCKNMVTVSQEQALFGKAHGGRGEGGKMCEACWSFYQSVQDKQVPCSKAGCKNTWTWTRFQQLESHVRGFDTPPRRLCPECAEEGKDKKDIQVPCRVKGCKNTWTWTAKMQVESKDKRPPRRLCPECFALWSKLQDQEIPCRVKGCKNTLSWSRVQQLEWIKEGRKVENPPKRMCPSCLEKFNLLKPMEVPCRISGCSHVWTWLPFEQLEAAVNLPLPSQKTEAAAPAAENAPVAENAPAAEKESQNPFHLHPPKRMCKECFAFFEKAKDLEQPCCNRGCEGKWIWTRSQQLTGHLHGHDQAPFRMCEDCQKALKERKPIQEPCQEAACQGTWTYEPADQLKDALLKRPPKSRHCSSCEKFLREHPARELVCEKCGESFPWTSQEQLLTHLGVFQKPTCCASCNTRGLQEQPPPPPVIIPAAQTAFRVEIPAGGPWRENGLIRDWPEGMTNQEIDRMEKAGQRVVFLGDDLVAEEVGTPSLPALLEASLKSDGAWKDSVVLNAGMRGCTTALGTLRLGRDVAPFLPHLVIFSFAFADARSSASQETGEAMTRLAEETQKLLDALKELPSHPKIICWLPHPVYPQLESNALWRENLSPDVQAMNRYGAVLRNLKAVCDKNQIAVADGKAIFDMQGQKTAMAGMATWNRANAEGCKTHLRAILEALKA